MPTQNLISATLADDAKARILQKLSEIRADLNFLITLDADQARSLFKASNGLTPLLDKAYSVVQSHPDIVPRYFSIEEMTKDLNLIAALHPIQDAVNELARGLHDTMIAANSDALVQALDVYTAVKQHSGIVPGLAVAQSEMSVFFQRNRKKVVEPPKPE